MSKLTSCVSKKVFDAGIAGCECADRFAGCGACASWLGDVLAGKRDSSRLSVLPSHTKRLHTHHAQPKYPGSLAAAQVADGLAEAANSPDHEFWSVDVDMLSEGVFDWTRVLGHRQITDVYLLALAVHHGGRFVTLDRRIALDAVKGARTKHLVALA